MVDQAEMTPAAPPAAFRDDDGAIRSEFLDRVQEAIERRDATVLQALVGRQLPADDAIGGRGIWMANQLCDLVQIRRLSTGNVVRLHLRLT